MSTPPFSRPGAIDLSALKRPATTSSAPAAGGAGGAPAGTGAYSVVLDEQNFQAEMEGSVDAPVVLVFYSPSQAPASAQLAADLETLSEEFQGMFLLGKVDIDTAAQIAQALQIQQVPLVALVMRGQLAPVLQDALPMDELREVLKQVLQAAAAQGVTGRVQPRVAPEGDAQGQAQGEDQVDPRYVPAQDALAEGDIDRAVVEYQKLVDANPADAEAAGGLAMAKVLRRTATADSASARAAAAENPDDVGAQTLVADLDLLGGHVEDAFGRLIDLIHRTAGDERDAVRTHLLGLFAAVGNQDPRVLRGRQNLASALF